MKTVVLALFLTALIAANAVAQKPTPTPVERPFLIAIEDVFYINGRGTVATGRIERGRVKVGDTVEIVGARPARTTTVIAIEMFRKMLTEAEAGANVGLILKGIEKSDIERGQVIIKPGSVKTYTKLKATIDMLPAAEGGRKTSFATGYRPQIYIRFGSFSGVVSLPAGKTEVSPGEKGVAVDITLDKEAPLEKGQVITLREGGRAVGSAVITALVVK
jgi:elongation factor Tu